MPETMTPGEWLTSDVVEKAEVNTDELLEARLRRGWTPGGRGSTGPSTTSKAVTA